jgi:hypothetical protein
VHLAPQGHRSTALPCPQALLRWCEGNEYDEPADLQRVLNKVDGELRTYQVESLKAQMLVGLVSIRM